MATWAWITLSLMMIGNIIIVALLIREGGLNPKRWNETEDMPHPYVIIPAFLFLGVPIMILAVICSIYMGLLEEVGKGEKKE